MIILYSNIDLIKDYYQIYVHSDNAHKNDFYYWNVPKINLVIAKQPIEFVG